MLGKRFAVMVYPWLKSTAFAGLPGRPNISSNLRYQILNDEASALAIELYDSVPSDLHMLMEDEPTFGELASYPSTSLNIIAHEPSLHQFKAAAGCIRSTQAHTLRKCAALIFNSKPEHFLTDFDRKSVPEIRHLLGYSTVSQEYSVWCPVLFPPDSTQFNHQYAFRNPALCKASTKSPPYYTFDNDRIIVSAAQSYLVWS